MNLSHIDFDIVRGRACQITADVSPIQNLSVQGRLLAVGQTRSPVMLERDSLINV